MAYLFLILIILIVLSMLFSISEGAFFGLNKLRLRLKRKNKDPKALRVGKLLDKKEQLLNTLLISNEVVNIFLSSILTSIAITYFGNSGVGYATFAATILLLIFGEITPKSIATRSPDKIAYALSGFVKFIYIVMTPIVLIATFFSNIILRIFGIKTTKAKTTYTEEEIKTFFDMSSESGIIEENENRIMSKIFKFSDLEAQDIMVPRTKIKAIDYKASYRDVIECSQRFGYTRFPVYRTSIDDIIGIIYLKDLLKFEDNQKKFTVQKVMRPPIFILGTKKMSSVQEDLFNNRQSMAIVVDEYSGTDGIITEKDISQEIFALPGEKSLRGKVFDFNSVENQNEFEINGSVLLRELQRNLNIPLDSQINETIGGWFIEQINRMPKNGDFFEYKGYVFVVKKIQSHRIERLLIKKIEEDENDK